MKVDGVRGQPFIQRLVNFDEIVKDKESFKYMHNFINNIQYGM